MHSNQCFIINFKKMCSINKFIKMLDNNFFQTRILIKIFKIIFFYICTFRKFLKYKIVLMLKDEEE